MVVQVVAFEEPIRGSYRNAGTGAGAGGRWTLYRNQRHSATRKRTPERKRQWRDQHSCSRGENPHLNPGYFPSPVFLLSSVPMAHCLTTPRLFPLVATIAHAQTPAACHPWLTLCVPESVRRFTCQFKVTFEYKHNLPLIFYIPH